MREYGEPVELHKVTVEGAMGFDEFIEWMLEKVKVDIKVDVKIDLTKILVTWINRHYDHKRYKIYLEKSDGTKEVIDVEVMKKGEQLEHLNVKVEEDDILHIDKIEK